MKRLRIKCLILMVCAMPTLNGWTFTPPGTPTFNQIPDLTITYPLPADAVLGEGSGGVPFPAFQGHPEEIVRAAFGFRVANPERPQPEKTGFHDWAALSDTSVSSEPPARTTHRRP